MDKDFLEEDFELKNPVAWYGSFFGPWIVAGLILLVYFLFEGYNGLKDLGVAIAATFLMLGRFVILFGDEKPIEFFNVSVQMTAHELFVMLTTMDFIVAFFVAFHMDYLFRLPFFGPKLHEMVSDGRFILKHQPWIRSVAFIGLVLFVIFPTSTTGSIGGSIFGRLLGMKRMRVVTAILIGSVLGNSLMLALSHWISQYLPSDSFWLKLVGILIMVVALILAERYFRSLKRKFQAKEDAEQERRLADATAADDGDGKNDR